MTVFKKSLSNMMEWYAHPRVHVQAHEAPKGYPTGFKFPARAWGPTWRTTDRCLANDACTLHINTRCGLVFVQGLVLLSRQSAT